MLRSKDASQCPAESRKVFLKAVELVIQILKPCARSPQQLMLHPLIRNGAIPSLLRYSRYSSITLSAWPSVYSKRPEKLRWASSHSRSTLPIYTHDTSTPLSKIAENYPEQDDEAYQVQQEKENVWESEDTDTLREDVNEKEETLPQDQVFEKPHALPHGAREAVLQALRVGNPLDLLYTFLEASQHDSFLRSLPTTTHLEILRTIQSQAYLDDFKTLYRSLQIFTNRKLKHGMRDLEAILSNYSSMVQTLVNRWRHSGRALSLEHYKVLLGVARVTYDGRLASFLFELMETDDIQPDTVCYNSLFEAQCWNRTSIPGEAYKLRVTPRSLDFRNPEHSHHRFTSYHTGKNSLKQGVIKKFSEMIKSGIIPDTKTYSMLILAMAREGDLGAVEAIITRVWDIDVSQVMADDTGSLLFENQLSTQSPVYPNQDLLTTIAHIYGINNQIPKALRVVDFVSRKYSIPIGIATWSQLAEWTFVLSSGRYGSDTEKKTDYSIGQLPFPSFETLWTTMTSEPYQIQPTIPMHNMRVKAFSRMGLLAEMIEAMREARLEMGELAIFRHIKPLAPNMEDSKSDKNGQEPFTTFEQSHISELRYMTQYRNHTMVARWLRLVLGQTERQPFYWQCRQVPDLLLEFEQYQTAIGSAYNISTGYMQFHKNNSFGGNDEARPIETMDVTIAQDNISNLSFVQGVGVCRSRPRKSQTRQQRLIRRHQEQAIMETGNPVRSRTGRPPTLIWPWHRSREVRDWIYPETNSTLGRLRAPQVRRIVDKE